MLGGAEISANTQSCPIGLEVRKVDSHFPYAFYAENWGYNCMLDKINAWDNSKVAYVAYGSITLGQYVKGNLDPLDVGTNGVIKTLTWTEFGNNQ
jgi:hypothetical protein